jgi:hypothetical protein
MGLGMDGALAPLTVTCGRFSPNWEPTTAQQPLSFDSPAPGAAFLTRLSPFTEFGQGEPIWAWQHQRHKHLGTAMV